MARPALKRTYHVTSDMLPLNKRVKRVERIQAERRPETKYKDFYIAGAVSTGSIAYVDITNISQGDSFDTRDGRLIKLHRVEVRGGTTSSSTIYTGYDVLLQTSKDNSTPAYADYLPVMGSYPELTKATVWRHQICGGGGSDSMINFVKSFKYPMKIHYDGSAGSNIIRNRTFVVVKNDVGAAGAMSIFIRVWFTDV